MALFGKEDRPLRPEDAPSAPAAPFTMGQSRGGESGGLQAHLGAGSRIEGKLTFDGSVQIDGHVEGEIQAQETVMIGEKAVINAQITAGTVIVKGKVTGDVTARTRIEMQAPAKLVGNITTPSLVIHEGVTFEGNCSMASAADAGKGKVAFLTKDAGRATSEAGK